MPNIAGYARPSGVCAGYPENYFSRLPLPTDVVLAIISHLRSDDLYHQETELTPL